MIGNILNTVGIIFIASGIHHDAWLLGFIGCIMVIISRDLGTKPKPRHVPCSTCNDDKFITVYNETRNRREFAVCPKCDFAKDPAP